VCQVVDAVDEGNLSIVAFHCDELPIHDEEAAEAFGITVGERDLIVVRKSIQLCDNAPVGTVRSFANVLSDRADARPLEM
jgi:hypothetical protein